MKIKNYKSIIAVFSFGLVLTGCEDRLDIEPRQDVSVEVALATGENIENILIGAYDEAGQAASYGGYLQLMSDLYGFTDEASWIGTFSQPREVFRKSIFVDNTFVRDLWLNQYEVINQVNLVIDNIELVDEESQDNVEGQARFLRALTYFDLVRSFGAPYVAGQQNDQLGVPLALVGISDYSVNLEIPRNTVEEVYNQIIDDLTTAYELLPPTNDIFADKYAAEGLLARVYLQQGEYELARDAADDVIENSGHELTTIYADAFNNDVDSEEAIFAFQVTTQSGTNVLVLHYASEGLGGRGGDVVIEQAFVDRFGDGDDRGDFFYINEDNDRRLTSKYINQFGNIPIIRMAEMYLIRAEANLRLGTSVGAAPLLDINLIRDRANATPLTTVTIADILNERELELAFEGFLIHDLQRTMRSVGDLPYDADLLTFPIPEREIDANSLLVQNPGYE